MAIPYNTKYNGQAIPLLGIHPRQIKTYVPLKMCLQKFQQHFSLWPKPENNPNNIYISQNTIEQICIYIYRHTTALVNFKNITLNESSQIERLCTE